MELLVPLAIFVLLLVVAWLVSAPLRHGAAAQASARDAAEREDLLAARDAKYREIRDAELDYQTGKLSKEDWRVLDRQLRAEAVELLRRLDALGPALE